MPLLRYAFAFILEIYFNFLQNVLFKASLVQSRNIFEVVADILIHFRLAAHLFGGYQMQFQTQLVAIIFFFGDLGDQVEYL